MERNSLLLRRYFVDFVSLDKDWLPSRDIRLFEPFCVRIAVQKGALISNLFFLVVICSLFSASLA
jgi:hypothetical protein